MFTNSETRVARQIEINSHLCKQASKLQIYFYFPLLIRAKKPTRLGLFCPDGRLIIRYTPRGYSTVSVSHITISSYRI